MLRKTPVALALGMAWGAMSMPAIAQTSPEPSTQLKEITVSSTRTARGVDNVPNSVTLMPARRIEQEGARDIKDLFRNEVDISVRAAPTRFTAAAGATGRAGNEGINIRGLEGNQVLMAIDGVRVPNSFSFGSFATGRGDFLPLDAAKTVEVLRGPASTQFGSDGLAGALSLQTLDPADLLKDKQPMAGFARLGYNSIDHSWATTLAGTGQSRQWQGLLLANLGRGHETINRGDNTSPNLTRTAPNPVDYDKHYLLAKASFALNAAHQFGLSLETQKREQDTEVYSARAVPPLQSTSTLGLDTHDKIERQSLAFSHRFQDLNGAWLQKAATRLYWQDAKVAQFANEDRNTAADRTRNNTYQSKLVGLSSLLESNLSGALNQRLSYGFDWSRNEISAVRDGTVAPFGETFPSKPFPDTTYTLSGAFVQSEIESGALSLIPGLRFDHYKLAPSSTDYKGGAVVALSDQALTPRLGLVWRLQPGFAPYAQWARGFRAPTPDQVNNGFTNLASGYTSVGNGNLKAERANSFEIGVRGKIDTLRYSFALFDNRYDNFISQQVVGGAGSPANPSIYQYINLADAHIQGAEMRAEWQFAPAWRANLGMAYAHGDSESNGVSSPLDSVEPFKSALSLYYDTAQWGARATWLHASSKAAGRIAPVTPAQFAPGAYDVLDLGLYWKAGSNLSLHANLNNVFNTRYWRWSDVRGLADNSSIKDAYTAPGRNAQLSLRYDF